MSAHFSRFLLINIAAFTLLAIAGAKGWVGVVVEADQSRLTLVIAGVLACGLALCAWRFATLKTRLGGQWYWENTSAWLDERIGTVRMLTDLCPLLGLAGTVVGFVMAFDQLDIGALSSADTAAGVIGGVLKGVGVALYTTLVGILAAVWLTLSYRTLESHAAELRGKE